MKNRMKDNTENIKVSYDSDADVLSLLSLSGESIDHAFEMGNLIVHVNERGKPILIEILEASHILRRELLPLSEVAAKFA